MVDWQSESDLVDTSRHWLQWLQWLQRQRFWWLTDSQRVTWTAFAILAMFILLIVLTTQPNYLDIKVLSAPVYIWWTKGTQWSEDTRTKPKLQSLLFGLPSKMYHKCVNMMRWDKSWWLDLFFNLACMNLHYEAWPHSLCPLDFWFELFLHWTTPLNGQWFQSFWDCVRNNVGKIYPFVFCRASIPDVGLRRKFSRK